MDELMAEIQVPRDESSLIMVIGVGGAGCNAVSNMWHAGVKGVTYLACNTDRKSLNINPVSNKVRLGTEGLGAGNRPERGRDAAIASLEDIRRYLMESGSLPPAWAEEPEPERLRSSPNWPRRWKC